MSHPDPPADHHYGITTVVTERDTVLFSVSTPFEGQVMSWEMPRESARKLGHMLIEAADQPR
jgi:hypothetical protein